MLFCEYLKNFSVHIYLIVIYFLIGYATIVSFLRVFSAFLYVPCIFFIIITAIDSKVFHVKHLEESYYKANIGYFIYVSRETYIKMDIIIKYP